VRNLGLEVLEIFVESAEAYSDRQTFKLREGYVPVIKHDIAKRDWREKNKDKQRLYVARNTAKKKGKPIPPLERSKVEIFWDGDGWYFAQPKNSERLGGPFQALHEAWKQADLNHLEVMTVCTTRGDRSYRG